MQAILELHTKPAGRFIGAASPSDLRKAAVFLIAIADTTEQMVVTAQPSTAEQPVVTTEERPAQDAETRAA